MIYKHLILLFAFSLSTHSYAETRSNKLCTKLIKDFLNESPKEVPAAVAHIHSYTINPGDAGRVVSVLVPSPNGAGFRGVLRDLSTQTPSNPWPDRFIISDGYPNGSFIFVDIRKNSPLNLQIKKIIKEIKTQHSIDPKTQPEEFLKHLSTNGSRYFSSQAQDSLSALGKDLYNSPNRFSLNASAMDIFNDFLNKPIGNNLYDVGQNKELVPFEYYFAKTGCTMCIHNALLSSLILREAGIPHKFKTGFASFSGPSYQNTGHSFIELADGRILDPTWNFLKKQKKHPKHPEWIEGAGWWWTANTHFPYLELN